MAENLIPGDLRKKLNPFSGGTEPKLFTYRNSQPGEIDSKRINIIPPTHGLYNADLAARQMISQFGTWCGTKIADLNDIQNYIPGIQIREMVQDTHADVVWDLLKYAVSGWSGGQKFADETSKMDEDAKKKMALDKICQGAYLVTKMKQPEFWGKIIEIFDKETWGDNELFNSEITKETDYKLSLKMMYNLYYRMVGKTITNYYEVPCSDTTIYDTCGSDGWNVGGNTVGGFGIQGGAQSILGKLLTFGLSNINLQTEPMWKGNKGSPHGGVSVKFSLFNTSTEAAVNNFQFISNIFPNNMWLQWAVFQQGPSIYDVKIDGGRRWFMCTGDFKCEGKGVFRYPSNQFFKKLTDNKILIKLDKNKTFRQIKIPDVYEITLNFKSLLPDNFNNAMFQYATKFTMDNKQPMSPFCNEDSMNKITNTFDTLLSTATGITTQKSTASEAYKDGVVQAKPK